MLDRVARLIDGSKLRKSGSRGEYDRQEKGKKAAERRQNVATAEGRGFGVLACESRGAE
jgi:hypothetical protein